MLNQTTTARHTRPTFGADHASDGVSDEIAILWSDYETASRRNHLEGRHRAA